MSVNNHLAAIDNVDSGRQGVNVGLSRIAANADTLEVVNVMVIIAVGRNFFDCTIFGFNNHKEILPFTGRPVCLDGSCGDFKIAFVFVNPGKYAVGRTCRGNFR